MAIVKNNVITEGFRGMFGGAIVFKNLRGKTIATIPPAPPKKQSELQRKNRQRFREATQYAHAVLLDPVKKEYYRARARKLMLPNAYTAAITDYLRKPEVTQVKIVEGKSQSGSNIIIHAVKKGFAIASVKVKIKAQDHVLESGTAIHKGDRQEWRYRSLALLEKNMQVEITITDYAGNDISFVKNVGDVVSP